MDRPSSPLRGAGCAKVFSEKASGANSDRTELRKVVSRMQDGDVLIVTRLDRLARSTRDLLNTLDEISKRGAGFNHWLMPGGYHDAARPVDADDVGRIGGV